LDAVLFESLLSFSGIIKLQRARVKYINQSDGISSIHVVVVVVCWPKTSRNPSKAPPQGEAGNVIF